MIATALLVCLLLTQEDSTARRLAMEAQNLYVSKDYPAAKERAEAGAKAGSTDSMILLAVIYSSGNGALRDYGEALRWYRQAADAGSAVAMYNLALLYQDGRGTMKDIDEANRWFRAAVDAGYKPGIASRLPSSNTVNGTGTPVTPPSVKFRQDPKYSDQARKMLITGEVLLSVVVGTDGIPRDIQIVNPLGFGLDQKAVEAAANWRFNPGMKDGHPVNVRVRIDVNFRFDKPAGQDHWRAGQMAFEKPDGTSGPLVTDGTTQPVNGPKDENGTVSFEFTVNESGHATDIRVLHGFMSRAANELTQQLAAWTFGYADKPDIPAGAKGRVRFILNEGDEDAKQPLYPAK